jgi:hypothetical protein
MCESGASGNRWVWTGVGAVSEGGVGVGTTTSYSKQDIDNAASAIGGQAGKFGSVGDQVPQNVNGAMFGTMADSSAVAGAVSALCSALHTEYSAAESLVGQIQRSLDATTQNNSDTEQANQHSFQVRQV